MGSSASGVCVSSRGGGVGAPGESGAAGSAAVVHVRLRHFIGSAAVVPQRDGEGDGEGGKRYSSRLSWVVEVLLQVWRQARAGCCARFH